MTPSDEYLRQVTIGELKPLNGTVLLATYDTRWPSRYEVLASRVRRALGERVALLEHVGSTSVPGLAAKPIIDMVLSVANSADEAAYVPALGAEGFELAIREPDWFQHRLLRASDIAGSLHVFSAGCEEVPRMIALRDRLRGNDGDRLHYEQVKRELAARTWRHRQHYADAKADVIREILARGDEGRPHSRQSVIDPG
jgi:GrpB-like predicted nucleotidyltransferase (UPF0157 family)